MSQTDKPGITASGYLMCRVNRRKMEQGIMYKVLSISPLFKIEEMERNLGSSLCLPIEEMLILNTLKTMLGTDSV